MERFLALLGDTRVPDGSWDAPWSDFGSILARFWLDSGAFEGGCSFGFSNESAFELGFAKAGNFASDFP